MQISSAVQSKRTFNWHFWRKWVFYIIRTLRKQFCQINKNILLVFMQQNSFVVITKHFRISTKFWLLKQNVLSGQQKKFCCINLFLSESWRNSAFNCTWNFEKNALVFYYSNAKNEKTNWIKNLIREKTLINTNFGNACEYVTVRDLRFWPFPHFQTKCSERFFYFRRQS